jgi:beta-glucuronidase
MDGKFYTACDQAGLLVWIEPTVYCYHPRDDAEHTSFADPEWRDLAERMVEEMIRTARNHVSVSIFGIGNECNTVNPEAEAFFKRLATVIRKNDPHRLISYAALYGNVGPLAEIVDILGINSYWGWYDKINGGKGLMPEDGVWQKDSGCGMESIDLAPMRAMLEDVLKNGPKNLALLLTEFGADSVPGYFSHSHDLWSEDYHAALLDEIFELAAQYPQIIGTFPFCFSDYRDPSKPVNGYWNELNLKGLVTYERRMKLSFGAIRKKYHEI